MWDIVKPLLASAVRHALTILATYLISVGALPTTGEDQFVAAGMLFAVALWSWWQKVGHANVAALLQKLTAAPSTKAAVQAATALPTGAAVKAIALLAILILGTLFMPVSAYAQLPRLKPLSLVAPRAAASTPAAAAVTSPVNLIDNLMAQLSAVQAKTVTDVIADINAADADAGTLTNPTDPASFKDAISHACYPAAVKFLQSLPTATAATGTLQGVQLFQKKRDFIAQVQAGLPTYLKLGCAPLLGDEIATFVSLMAMVGVKVIPAGLTAMFPAIAPITLPALALTP